MAESGLVTAWGIIKRLASDIHIFPLVSDLFPLPSTNILLILFEPDNYELP